VQTPERYGLPVAILLTTGLTLVGTWVWWTSESVVYSVEVADQCLAQVRARNHGELVDADLVFVDYRNKDVGRYALMRDEDVWVDVVTKIKKISPQGRNVRVDFDYYPPVSVPIACP
jgi:hypothetical protein